MSDNGRLPAAQRALTVEQLQADIRLTRAELGETVEELAARMDVKARMEEGMAQARERMRDSAAQARARVQVRARRAGHAAQDPAVWVGALLGAAVVAIVTVALGRRRL